MTGTEATNINHVQVFAGKPVELPGNGQMLANAEMVRSGADLHLTAPDGHIIVVDGYFAQHPVPVLVTADGSKLSPQTVSELLPNHEAAAAAPVHDTHPAGKITEVSGEAHIIHADGTHVTAAVNMPVYQGDVIETAKTGAVNIIFSDNTNFAVSENAHMSIDQYAYNPSQHTGSTFFSVLQGLFVYTSGLVGKTDPGSVSIDTPVGSIGIRGTVVAGHIYTNGQSSTITILDGAIALTNGSGTHEMNKNFDTVSVNNYQGTPVDKGVMDAHAFKLAYHNLSSVAHGTFQHFNTSNNGHAPAPASSIGGETHGSQPVAPAPGLVPMHLVVPPPPASGPSTFTGSHEASASDAFTTATIAAASSPAAAVSAPAEDTAVASAATLASTAQTDAAVVFTSSPVIAVPLTPTAVDFTSSNASFHGLPGQAITVTGIGDAVTGGGDGTINVATGLNDHITGGVGDSINIIPTGVSGVGGDTIVGGVDSTITVTGFSPSGLNPDTIDGAAYNIINMNSGLGDIVNAGIGNTINLSSSAINTHITGQSGDIINDHGLETYISSGGGSTINEYNSQSVITGGADDRINILDGTAYDSVTGGAGDTINIQATAMHTGVNQTANGGVGETINDGGEYSFIRGGGGGTINEYGSGSTVLGGAGDNIYIGAGAINNTITGGGNETISIESSSSLSGSSLDGGAGSNTLSLDPAGSASSFYLDFTGNEGIGTIVSPGSVKNIETIDLGASNVATVGQGIFLDVASVFNMTGSNHILDIIENSNANASVSIVMGADPTGQLAGFNGGLAVSNLVTGGFVYNSSPTSIDPSHTPSAINTYYTAQYTPPGGSATLVTLIVTDPNLNVHGGTASGISQGAA